MKKTNFVKFFFVFYLAIFITGLTNVYAVNLLQNYNPGFEYAGDTNLSVAHWHRIADDTQNIGNGGQDIWYGDYNLSSGDCSNIAVNSAIPLLRERTAMTSSSGNYSVLLKPTIRGTPIYSDFYLGEISDANLCFDFNAQVAVGTAIGFILKSNSGKICPIGSAAHGTYALNIWNKQYCTILPKGTYNGYLGIFVNSEVGGYAYIDNLSVELRGLRIYNFSDRNGLINEPFLFETKLFDLNKNTFINSILDFNANFSDGNVILAYNPISGFYEGLKTFSTFGVKNYVLRAKNIDGNFYLDSNTVNIVAATNYIIPISGVVKNYEYSDGSTIYANLIASDNSNFAFSILHDYSEILDFNISFTNSDTSGKRYFIYSSTDNITYSLDNSLTFGSNTVNNDGLQKIWNGSTKTFDYYFSDSIFPNEVKYFSMKYQAPIKQWNSIANSIEWDKRLTPEAKDLNNLIVDIFQTSSYAFMQNELIEKIPAITSVPAKNLIFLFTGKALIGSNTIFAGQVAISGATAANSAVINSTERTYDFQSSAGGILSQKTPATVSTLQIYDYAIVPAGLFLKNVSVTDLQGGELPATILSGASWQYLNESQKYKVNSQIYDQDGTLTRIEVFVYLETVADANLVSYSIFDYVGATEAGQTHNLSLEMPGIVDFTIGNKKMLVKIRATAGGYSEISSEWLLFRQFPYMPGDFSLSSSIDNKLIAQSPEITVTIRDILPETLRGFIVSIYKAGNSPDHADFNKTFYKDTDFFCNGFDCFFSKEVSEWVFPSSGHWNFNTSVLLTTQNADWNNSITSLTKSFLVSVREFDTFRILEGLDRQGAGLAAAESKYRNDEEIILVFQVRDKNPGINLKNNLDVEFNIARCSTATSNDCNYIGYNFKPDSSLYDETTGYNYYFIKKTFLEEDGSLLYDENYYRISALVYDRSQEHGAGELALLTSKCVSYLAGFIANTFNMNLLGGGCDFPQEPIITDSNTEREMRIKIDNSITLTPPKIHAVYCLKNDKANLYFNPLEQEQLCAVVYSFNKQPIDGFNFFVSNNNSDFSKTGANAQYLQSKIPYSLILFNDLGISKQLLSTKNSRPAVKLVDLLLQGFDSISQISINTGWSEAIKFYLNNCVGFPTSAACFFIDENAYNFVSKNFDSDLNLNVEISAGNFDGVLFVKLKGIKALNIQDYLASFKDLNAINPKDFIEYSNYKNYAIKPSSTAIEYFGNGNTKFFSEEISSPLVINEKLTNAQLKNFDANNPGQSSIPIPVIANFISDLVYNNGVNAQRVITPLTIFSQFEKPSDLDALLSNPFGFILKNLLYLSAALIFLAAISVAWYNFTQKGGGSNTVIVRR